MSRYDANRISEIQFSYEGLSTMEDYKETEEFFKVHPFSSGYHWALYSHPFQTKDTSKYDMTLKQSKWTSPNLKSLETDGVYL